MKSKLLKFIFYSLGIFVLLIFFTLCTKAMYGNIDSNSHYLQPPYDGQYSAFETSHDRSSYATLLALDENGTTSLTKKLADTATPDAGFYKGKYYSFFPPGLAFGALPFYKLGKLFNLSLFFTYFTIIIYAVLGLFILYKISREIFKLPVWVSCFVVICTGFASTFLNFTTTFYQHTPSVFLLLLMYYSAYRFKYGEKHTWLWALVSFSCYGFSVFFDYPNMVIFAPVLLYLLHSGFRYNLTDGNIRIRLRTSLVVGMLALVSTAGLHIVYNYKNFGNYKRFSNSLPRYAPHLEKDLAHQAVKEGDDAVEKKEAISFSLIETNLFHGIYVILFENNKSLLVNFPLYFLSILGLWNLRKKLNLELLLPLAVMVTNLFLYASFHDPWGGWAFGPRYLIPSMPFVCLYFGVWLAERNKDFIRKLVAVLFFSYGTMVALVGVVGINSTIPMAEYQPYMNNRPVHFMDDFRFLDTGKNGTFIYNTLLKDQISAWEYYYLLLATSISVCIICLFIVPYLEYKVSNSRKDSLLTITE